MEVSPVANCGSVNVSVDVPGHSRRGWFLFGDAPGIRETFCRDRLYTLRDLVRAWGRILVSHPEDPATNHFGYDAQDAF